LTGRFCLVLHSHLPYVLNHGTWPHGTDWLHEASTGTYIPLLQVLEELLDEGYHPKITLGITPVLAEQLSQPAFQESFLHYINQRILSARKDERYFYRIKDNVRQHTAQFWIEHFSNIKNRFVNQYERDILKQFRIFQDNGSVELITCGATHGYFPLLGYDQNIRAQISLALEIHQKHFGKRPNGIWLPECGYRPHYQWKNPLQSLAQETERLGIEEILSDFGIKFFFTDSALLFNGETTGVQRIIQTNNWNYTQLYEEETFLSGKRSPCDIYFVQSQLGEGKQCAVFAREPKTASQVWSGIMGYPGDPFYLEFHKKNFPGGHLYWRVTDSKLDLGKKLLYSPEIIPQRIENQATHFVSVINSVLTNHKEYFGKDGIICAQYDSELFGHWWFEGPQFLNSIFKKIERENKIQLTTASEELNRRKTLEVVALPEGSWGEGNNHQVWLNEKTEWTWKLVYEAEEKFQSFLSTYSDSTNTFLKSVIEQTARELLFLESSDWQFLISQKSAKDYAEKRFLEHNQNFMLLLSCAKKIMNEIQLSEEETLLINNCKSQNGIFNHIDIDWWR